jgi:hypothetical protein
VALAVAISVVLDQPPPPPPPPEAPLLVLALPPPPPPITSTIIGILALISDGTTHVDPIVEVKITVFKGIY